VECEFGGRKLHCGLEDQKICGDWRRGRDMLRGGQVGCEAEEAAGRGRPVPMWCFFSPYGCSTLAAGGLGLREKGKVYRLAF
jgi:hypothetical protein